jgi:RNA polymerase sigma-70 factor, ECF subfamily
MRMALDSALTGWPAVEWRVGGRGLFGIGERSMNRARSYADVSDAELISWSADGDRRAFDAIVARHGAFALRVALRLMRDPVAAEDVVQEAMVRAWTRAAHFDERRGGFTTWLYRIVVNLCIDRRRRVQPERIPEDFDAADPAAGADEMMEANERNAALAGALGALPVRQRAAMTLVYDEGMSGAEAARVLRLSAKAVERLLARARAFLRERLLAGQDWMESEQC